MMSSPGLSDKELAEKYGRRLPGVAVFEPCEFGHHCPKMHNGEDIVWSEFNEHIWCFKCRLDYLSAECFIRRPSWMRPGEFKNFVSKLPFEAKILRGVDRFLDNK